MAKQKSLNANNGKKQGNSDDGNEFYSYPINSPGECIINYDALNKKIIADGVQSTDLLSICEEKSDLEIQIGFLESQTKALKERLTYLDEFVLPETLTTIGATEITLSQSVSGQKTVVQIANDYHARINEKRQDEAERILLANGYKDNLSHKDLLIIHTMTLKAFARKQMERIEKEGEKYDGEAAKLKSLFNLYKSTKAIVKEKKIAKNDESFFCDDE